MNAAERIFEYTQLETEDLRGTDNLRASWPEEGKLEVKKLEVGYANDLPAILKGVTFSVEGNQRVGVVGRTGAGTINDPPFWPIRDTNNPSLGKSTLSLALFRFLKARKGSIVIDGIDISTIKLHDLRTRLAIIPQDPVLFSGTIRSNLDPFNNFSDVQLKEVLERVQLITSTSTDNTLVSKPVKPAAEASSIVASSTTAIETSLKEDVNIFLDLNSAISQSGSNISQGQRQLLCLARAMLSRPKLLVLDEATSAVDMYTDLLIQRSIREEFANTTLLVIAHRLSTVADFDKILVMKDGVVVEFGSPRELLERKDGIFKDMVMHSGEKEELERMILSY
jgi:ABC-type multidrug transport system fused ATPase/permease subunit